MTPDRLELDLVGAEMLEESPAFAQQDGDEVNLQLVEDTGGKRQLGGAGAMDQHVLLTGSRHRRPHRPPTSLMYQTSGHRASSASGRRLRMKIGTPS